MLLLEIILTALKFLPSSMIEILLFDSFTFNPFAVKEPTKIIVLDPWHISYSPHSQNNPYLIY